jgi:ribose-phosphate pyrophosphokinase
VTGITASGEKKLLLFSGRAFPGLTSEIAGCLGIEPTPTRLYDFANGEIFVRFLESVRGCDAFVLQSHTAPINQWIMEHLIMVDALKRASAKRITVVAPFFGYARQDKKSRGREPISARLMTDLFATAGADRLMAVDLHTAQIQGFFDGPVDHLFALPILASYLEERLNLAEVTVVAPEPAGSGSASGGPTGSAARWRSSTSAVTPMWPTRSRSSRSSATWSAGPASWWTT